MAEHDGSAQVTSLRETIRELSIENEKLKTEIKELHHREHGGHRESGGIMDEKKVKEMWDELLAIAETIDSDTYFHYMADWALRYYGDKIRIAPAAVKVHSAFKGGLLKHTLAVTKMCRAVVEFYPDADKDLLIAAAILHDIGKIRCYGKDKDGNVCDLQDRHLLGHIAITQQIITEASARQPVNDKNRLLHCILSHHGQLEWGSPVTPKTVEAVILHNCDMIEARASIITEAFEGLNPETSQSEYVKYLGGPAFR